MMTIRTTCPLPWNTFPLTPIIPASRCSSFTQLSFPMSFLTLLLFYVSWCHRAPTFQILSSPAHAADTTSTTISALLSPYLLSAAQVYTKPITTSGYLYKPLLFLNALSPDLQHSSLLWFTFHPKYHLLRVFPDQAKVPKNCSIICLYAAIPPAHLSDSQYIFGSLMNAMSKWMHQQINIQGFFKVCKWEENNYQKTPAFSTLSLKHLRHIRGDIF